MASPRLPRGGRSARSSASSSPISSTARAEESDPEDVRALLRVYHERTRDELERLGGTVEKFIGDAVVAVFGAPVAHEDDAPDRGRSSPPLGERARRRGEAGESETQLELARAFYCKVGATAYLAEADAILAAAG